MKRIDRNLTASIGSVFTKGALNSLARETKFIQRAGSLTAEGFISLCAFSKTSVCKDSLSNLSSDLASEERIKISSQALNERFNKYSVEFLRSVTKEILIKQNCILSKNSLEIQDLFNRINVIDSTTFKLSDNLKEVYRGTGGTRANAAVKILLQYDILSGKFLLCDVDKAATSETTYLPKLQQYIEPKDLILKDLGYFKLDDLNFINESKAYYISKIKKYTLIYIKEGKRYSQVNILEKAKSLEPGQTLEIPDAYLGADKILKTRIIITKLSEKDKQKRELKNIEESKKSKSKSRMDAEDLNLWNGINIYATNLNENLFTASQIHDLYTLRWQVEIMFKIWKSIFKIDKIKKVSLHRFECFLYGKLISILLSSIVVFKSKEIIYCNHGKTISDFKAFAIVKDNSCKIKEAIFKSIDALSRALNRIINLIFTCAVKSKKKHRKSTFEILKSARKQETTVEEVAI